MSSSQIGLGRSTLSIRNMEYPVMDVIPVENALLSLFDKSAMNTFIPGLAVAAPGVKILSTGGTADQIETLLKRMRCGKQLKRVEDLTGFPEMEGGLVKTLHPAIHAGILAERYNPAHVRYLQELGTDYIDLVVVNVYDFAGASSRDIEVKRGHIDIGGPTMVWAAIKNYLSVAVVCEPEMYQIVIDEIWEHGGISLETRFRLAQRAAALMSDYRQEIAQWFQQVNYSDLQRQYKPGRQLEVAVLGNAPSDVE